MVIVLLFYGGVSAVSYYYSYIALWIQQSDHFGLGRLSKCHCGLKVRTLTYCSMTYWHQWTVLKNILHNYTVHTTILHKKGGKGGTALQ